jgi:branched-chain amino acid transport system permease protein
MLIPTLIFDGINITSTIIDFGIFTLIYLIIALTVNLEYGYAGVPNFGKVLFVAAGGLMAGSLSFYLMAYILNIHSSVLLADQFLFHGPMSTALANDPLLNFGIFIFMVVSGGLIGALFGFLASYPAIRLREDYLGMLLLAAGEFFLIFTQSYTPITDGTDGINIPDVLFFTGNQPELREVWLLGILAVFTFGTFLYCERVARSPLGRTLRAMRDNEAASEALGKNNTALRRNVLIVGSAISGIAGVMVVIQAAYISPTTFTRIFYTFYPFVIVILGGAANNYGVILGAISFEGIYDTITNFQIYAGSHNIVLPIDLNAVTPIAIGVLVIVFLYWRPKGLLSEKASLTIKKYDLAKILQLVRNKEGAADQRQFQNHTEKPTVEDSEGSDQVPNKPD